MKLTKNQIQWITMIAILTSVIILLKPLIIPEKEGKIGCILALGESNVALDTQSCSKLPLYNCKAELNSPEITYGELEGKRFEETLHCKVVGTTLDVYFNY